jgi:hypothetical protein
MVAGPVLEAVQDDKLPIVEDALEFNPLPRPLALHPLEIVDEALLTVRDAGVVLNILVASIPFDRFTRATIVEHQVVKGDHIHLVSFNVIHITPRFLRSPHLLVNGSTSGSRRNPRLRRILSHVIVHLDGIELPGAWLGAAAGMTVWCR